MHQRLTLIGYRASGKSTIGPRVARRLRWRFVDTDRELERSLGQTVASFFAIHGEAAFREREAVMLSELLGGDLPLVLATGGGAILRPANRSVLRERGGLIAYLNAPVTLLQDRLRTQSGNRPSLSGKPVWEEVPEILALREPLYRELAGLVIDATRPPAEQVDTLARTVENLWRKPIDNWSKPSPPAG